MTKLTEWQEQCQENLPRSAVQTRKGGGGVDLSYVSGFYIFDEMNRIFGPGKWGYHIGDLSLVVDEMRKNRKGQEQHTVQYLAQVTLNLGPVASDSEVTWDHTQAIRDVGFGSGFGLTAHEDAAKEAVTDAVKRCCRVLGRRLGLALYDKEQRYVADDLLPPLLDAIGSMSTKAEIESVKLQIQGVPENTPTRSAAIRAYKAKVQELNG